MSLLQRGAFVLLMVLKTIPLRFPYTLVYCNTLIPPKPRSDPVVFFLFWLSLITSSKSSETTHPGKNHPCSTIKNTDTELRTMSSVPTASSEVFHQVEINNKKYTSRSYRVGM